VREVRELVRDPVSLRGCRREVLLVRVDVALAATLRFGGAMSNITATTFLKAVGLLSGCSFSFFF
jgi:hypothetical protein